jgi:two-component system, repressor protein LuxO
MPGFGVMPPAAESQPLVLLVEDSEPLSELYRAYIRREPIVVRQAATLAAAKEMLLALRPAALLLDLELPDGSGLDLIETARSAGLDPAAIVITGHGSVNVAVDAMRAGAYDFLVKPVDGERLLTTLRNALERRRLAQIVEALGTDVGAASFEGFIGADLSMQAIYRIINLAAKSRSTVFITGESGTGKEVCAEAIHRRSPRRNGAFVALNCGAVPKELMESEIFGHVKGAFTGATTDRDGAATRADGGTLFLDELCEMDPALQVKLLRFVQTGAVQPVGSDAMRKPDVRIICATNRTPLIEVEAGRLREDLYYRLHVLPIELPPLRDRGSDVLLLARHFLAAFSREEGRRFRGFAADAEARLCACRWPGNVRQLQNVIRQIVVVHDGDLVSGAMLPADFDSERLADDERTAAPMTPATPPAPAATAAIGRKDAIVSLAELERQAIERAIELCGGNMTEAAARLGVNVSTIYRKRQGWSKAAE